VTASVHCLSLAHAQQDASQFFSELRARLLAGARLLTWFGAPAREPGSVALTAVLVESRALQVLRTEVNAAKGFHSLSNDWPALHIFERELHEQHQVAIHGHPWLKPVRFPAGLAAGVAGHPYYRLEGKDVHEVAVGPIHAGVIEPGHFRFQCLGETVHHLEIQLGYQHRGVEAMLLRQRNSRDVGRLVETVAGDSSVAHGWACAAAYEALAGLEASEDTQRYRGLGLELERVAMHLAGLAGLSTDVAFLQGAATYGRLRTTAINSSMRVCGSRLGRGWIRAGGVSPGLPAGVAPALRANLRLLETDVAIINTRFRESLTVRQRLKGVGRLPQATAAELGLVGQAARASGGAFDARVDLAAAPYLRLPVTAVVEHSGDCWARAMLRVREVDESLRWLKSALDAGEVVEPQRLVPGALAPEHVVVSVCEGWRGEVVHCAETDATGALRSYRVQDPSLRNWFGLAMAVRDNDISDFPICNKSFDLSYCGHDL
jgi:Ni,Fe-hydrogenase III large subunit